MQHIRFLLKVLAFAALPLLPPLLLYCVGDPFKVLRGRDDYFADGLSVNKGVVTLAAFERGYGRHRYNAFIIGSSLSCYYAVEDWLEHLPAGARGFHFDTSQQSIRTMRRLVDYLEHSGADVEHALLVLDPFIFRIDPRHDAMVYLDPPQIREAWYAPVFHTRMFANFLNMKYMTSYVPWALTGRKKHYSEVLIFEPQPIVWNARTNEESIPQWDSLISSNPADFYAMHKIDPLPAHYSDRGPLITPDIEEDLRVVAATFRRLGTDYKVVVGPNRRLEVLGPVDEALMQEIFGNKFVNLGRCFSNELRDERNFYDNTHYRRPLARKIMERVYR